MHSTNRRSGYGTGRAKGSALERSKSVEKIWDDSEAAGRSQGSVGVGLQCASADAEWADTEGGGDFDDDVGTGGSL